MTELNAYLAGYTDGDGCFFITKAKTRFRNRFYISSTHKPVLDFFSKHFGCPVRKNHTKFSHWKQQYVWFVTGVNAAILVNNMLPYLVEKNIQAKIFIKFIQETSKNGKYILMEQMKESRSSRITENTISNIRNLPIIGFQNDYDFAYLAGLIDSECSLNINKYKPKDSKNYVYKTVLCCNNSSADIFYWLHQRMGGCMSFLNRNSKNPNHSNQITWKLGGKKLFPVLQKVLPYLINKKEQCKILIEFYQTTLPNGGDRQSQAFRDAYFDIITKREVLVNNLHILNKKGVNNV